MSYYSLFMHSYHIIHYKKQTNKPKAIIDAHFFWHEDAQNSVQTSHPYPILVSTYASFLFVGAQLWDRSSSSFLPKKLHLRIIGFMIPLKSSMLLSYVASKLHFHTDTHTHMVLMSLKK